MLCCTVVSCYFPVCFFSSCWSVVLISCGFLRISKLLHKSLWLNILFLCCKIKITSITQNLVKKPARVCAANCVPLVHPYLFHGSGASSACCALNEQSICFWSRSDCEHSSRSMNSLPPALHFFNDLFNLRHHWCLIEELQCNLTTLLHHGQLHYKPNSTTHNLNLLMHDVTTSWVWINMIW